MNVLQKLLGRKSNTTQTLNTPLAGPLESKVSEEMLATLQNARARYGDDPFRLYREQRTLPEKFIYGMNCLLDTWAVQNGDQYAQMVYEEIRKDRNAYTVCTDTRVTDVEGIPVLFTVKLGAAIAAANRVAERSESELRVTPTNRREVLSTYVYHEPDPETTIGLDAFLREVNRAVQEPRVVFKTSMTRITDCAADLTPESAIVYKSKFAPYWHFLIIRGLDGTYAYGPRDRKVRLSYCVGESGEILLLAPLSIKRTHFTRDQELGESELKEMTIVYRYKPYDETIERLVAGRQW